MADERGQGKNVYLTLHENFVRKDIAYIDRATGEQRTFNQVRLPADTVIDGRDVGGYEFSPFFVDALRFKGPEWRDIPLLADREVWLKRSVLDPEEHPVTDADGKRVEIQHDVADLVAQGEAELVKLEFLVPTQIGRASVGKECRSRWSPYH